MQNKDIKTLGYVIRRTNYGEADRILNIITPSGKISAIAKGARKEKSKLAGGIEMFTLSEYNIHFGKNDFGIVTGVKMKMYYSEILKDLNRLELAASIMQKVGNAAEGNDSPDFFNVVDQSLKALNSGENLSILETWYVFKIKKLIGEEVNLYRDVQGRRLMEGKKYCWDINEMAFSEVEQGEYDANVIKLLRLMVSNDLTVMQRVKAHNDTISKALKLTRIVV